MGYAQCGTFRKHSLCFIRNYLIIQTLVEYYLTPFQPKPHSLPVPLHYVAIHIHMEAPQAQEEFHTQKLFHSTSKGMQ